MPRPHALLEGIVDYAGLFPPASLDMGPAVQEYARQRRSEESWMLAAFVVPASRLAELASAAREHRTADESPWPLSVLLGADPEAGLRQWADFESAHADLGRATAFEFRPDTPDTVAQVTGAAPAGVEVFCELDWREDPGPWMPALREAGARAKIRTGGVEEALIPTVEAVVRFLRTCADAGVGLKFTAGLHHPVRAEHPLSYAKDAPRGTMHGFLNVFTAAALVAAGRVDDATLTAVLEETDPSTFSVPATGGVRWRDLEVGPDDLRTVRERFARSFGSCSFAEPVHDLQTLGMP